MTDQGLKSSCGAGLSHESPVDSALQQDSETCNTASLTSSGMHKNGVITVGLGSVPRRLPVSLKKWVNRIHQGDCIDLMKRMPAESIDLIVTSPPYNLRKSTGGGMRNGGGGFWKNAGLLKGYAGGFGDDMPYEQYVQWQIQCLQEMMRLLKDTGAIFYNHKWRVQNGLLQDRYDIVKHFPIRQIIIWQRAGGFNFNLQYLLPTYEVIYLICKPQFKLVVGDVEDIWSIKQERNNPHPAPFPVEIPQRCIETTGAEVVLDPFMGSGTTAVAAKLAGIDWIGLEKSEEYCIMANERLAKMDSATLVPRTSELAPPPALSSSPRASRHGRPRSQPRRSRSC